MNREHLSLKDAVITLTHEFPQLKEEVHLLTQKMDFLVAGFVEDRSERKSICQDHRSRIKRLERWAIGVTAGGGLTGMVLLYLKEEIKGKLGIGK